MPALFIKCFLSLLLVAVLSACSTAPQKPQQLSRGDYSYAKQYLSWLIEKEMQAANVPAVSIALVDDQQVVWSAGFGYADVANNKPATGKTLYRAGSISKLFTATAAMQLAEQGRMAIDAPLTTYLPSFSMKSRFDTAVPITPRQLMTHHSGLPNSRNQGMWVKNPEPFTTLVEQLRDDYVTMPPQQVFGYSNLGFSLLGHALANVAGSEFPQYLDQALLQPLAMHDSSFRPTPEQLLAMAKGYRNGEEVELPGLRDIPAGALHSSVDDLSQFIRMIFANGKYGERQIIQAETLAEMLRRQNDAVALDFDLQMGLGWFLESASRVGGERRASHAGGTLLYHSKLALLPERKLGVLVMSNASSGRQVVDKVAYEALKLALETKTGQPPAEITQEQLPDMVDTLETPPFDLEGYYAGTMGLIEISRQGQHYFARALGKHLSLQPRQGGWMSPQYKLLGLIPLSTGLNQVLVRPAVVNNRNVLVVRNAGQAFLLGEKIIKKPIPQQVYHWLGRLRIRNADPALPVEDIELSIEQGLAFIRYRIPALSDQEYRIALVPVAEDVLVIAGIGHGMGETIKLVQRDGDEFIWYSGYEIVRDNN